MAILLNEQFPAISNRTLNDELSAVVEVVYQTKSFGFFERTSVLSVRH